MSPETSDGWGWIQTVFATTLGLFGIIFGGGMVHLSGRVDRVQDDLRGTLDAARKIAEEGDDKLWTAFNESQRLIGEKFDRLAEHIVAAREESTRYRENMLCMVATKGDIADVKTEIERSGRRSVELLDARVAPLLEQVRQAKPR